MGNGWHLIHLRLLTIHIWRSFLIKPILRVSISSFICNIDKKSNTKQADYVRCPAGKKRDGTAPYPYRSLFKRGIAAVATAAGERFLNCLLRWPYITKDRSIHECDKQQDEVEFPRDKVPGNPRSPAPPTPDCPSELTDVCIKTLNEPYLCWNSFCLPTSHSSAFMYELILLMYLEWRFETT